MAPASKAATAAPASSLPEADALLVKAEASIRELEQLEERCYEVDRVDRLRRLAADVCKDVDAAMEMQRLSGSEVRAARAKGAYLKGRACSLVEGRECEAEELLAKALRLSPEMLAAWNALGEVFWNLRNYSRSKECFEKAIEHCGENAVSLRSLSMVLRAVDAGDGVGAATRRAENFAEALNMAKRAVALDASDPQNWETLGNAYVGDFFISARHPDELNRAMIAYKRAEAACERIGQPSLSLQLNRGKAAKYVEDYELALRSFMQAQSLGAAAAPKEVAKVVELAERLAGYAERRGDLKAKRLRELIVDIGSQAGEHRTLGELKANGGKASLPLAARVVSVIDRLDDMPVIVVCCDSRGDFFALSVYGAHQATVTSALVPMRSCLQVRNGDFRQISLKTPGGEQLSYPCVRVTHPRNVSVVGRGTLAAAAVPSKFSAGADRLEALPASTLAGESSAAVAKAKLKSKAKAGIGSHAGGYSMAPAGGSGGSPNASAATASGAAGAQEKTAEQQTPDEVWRIDPEIQRWIDREDALRRKAEQRKLREKMRRKLSMQEPVVEQSRLEDSEEEEEDDEEETTERETLEEVDTECGTDNISIGGCGTDNISVGGCGIDNLSVGGKPGSADSAHGEQNESSHGSPRNGSEASPPVRSAKLRWSELDDDSDLDDWPSLPPLYTEVRMGAAA
eukprot:TRINITY_DN7616_c0_g3_i1.p1 TRINITY_DN7616_c0_g3~~TRINITY_DN7616_c0_g3_i1.p1  ORF type:complete len:762 (+),score=177.64 TRINITY_DN7616_c0_g3_i1:232-2286(+)